MFSFSIICLVFGVLLAEECIVNSLGGVGIGCPCGTNAECKEQGFGATDQPTLHCNEGVCSVYEYDLFLLGKAGHLDSSSTGCEPGLILRNFTHAELELRQWEDLYERVATRELCVFASPSTGTCGVVAEVARHMGCSCNVSVSAPPCAFPGMCVENYCINRFIHMKKRRGGDCAEDRFAPDPGELRCMPGLFCNDKKICEVSPPSLMDCATGMERGCSCGPRADCVGRMVCGPLYTCVCLPGDTACEADFQLVDPLPHHLMPTRAPTMSPTPWPTSSPPVALTTTAAVLSSVTTGASLTESTAPSGQAPSSATVPLVPVDVVASSTTAGTKVSSASAGASDQQFAPGSPPLADDSPSLTLILAVAIPLALVLVFGLLVLLLFMRGRRRRRGAAGASSSSSMQRRGGARTSRNTSVRGPSATGGGSRTSSQRRYRAGGPGGRSREMTSFGRRVSSSHLQGHSIRQHPQQQQTGVSDQYASIPLPSRAGANYDQVVSLAGGSTTGPVSYQAPTVAELHVQAVAKRASETGEVSNHYASLPAAPNGNQYATAAPDTQNYAAPGTQIYATPTPDSHYSVPGTGMPNMPYAATPTTITATATIPSSTEYGSMPSHEKKSI